MSYVPAGSTPAQLNTFARRLSLHLARPEQRSSWMAFQQSLARAVGYPDAHAAQQAQKRSLAFLRPFSQSGDVRPAPLRLPVLPGASAHRLAKWTKALWKQGGKRWQSSHSVDVRQMLAQIWGFPNWGDLITQCHAKCLQHGLHEIRLPWLQAANCEALAALAQTRGGNANRGGLHTVLGQTANGDWLGLNTDMATCHVLAFSKSEDQRRQLTRAWAGQRILAGDRVLVFSGSDQVIKPLSAIARSCGREDEVQTFDWTRPGALLPCPIPESPGALARWLTICLKEPDNDLPDAILTWISHVVLVWMAHRAPSNSQDSLRTLATALRDPEHFDHAWWEIKGTPWVATVNIAQRLPQVWEQWSKRLGELMDWFEAPSSLYQEGNIVLGRLPSDVSPWSRTVVRAVTGCLYMKVVEGLGSKTNDYIKDDCSSSEPPGLMISTDLPLGWGWQSAMLPAQARALGYAIVSILDTDKLSTAADNLTDTRHAWIANTGTKLILGSVIPSALMQAISKTCWQEIERPGPGEVTGGWIENGGKTVRISVAMHEASAPAEIHNEH